MGIIYFSNQLTNSDSYASFSWELIVMHSGTFISLNHYTMVKRYKQNNTQYLNVPYYNGIDNVSNPYQLRPAA